MNNIIKHHPKMMVRIANIYIDKYVELGHESAKTWSNSKFDDEFITALGPYVRTEAKKRGHKAI